MKMVESLQSSLAKWKLSRREVKRQDIRGNSYQDVVEMAKEIKCAFDKL